MTQINPFRAVSIAALLCACALTGTAQAQVVTPGVAGPVSYDNPIPTPSPITAEFGVAFDGPVPQIALPLISNAALINEDVVSPPPGKRLRIGVVRDIAFDPATAGAWARLADGSRVWAVEVVSPSAYQIGVHLADVNLPPGGRLISYSTLNPADIEGPWADRGPLASGEIWTPQHVGQVIRIEAYLPADYQGPLPLRIADVQHVYRNFFSDPDIVQPAAAGTCHNDVTCYPTWANTAKAIGRMTFVVGTSVSLCTGQLMATQNNDLTPYFLTANHCIGPTDTAAAASLYVCWNYNTTTCNGTPPTALNFTNPPNWSPRTAGSTIVSAGGSSNSDYSLLMLTGAIPANLFWAGWTNNVIANATPIAGIHHPSGDYKRISFGTKAAWVSGDCTLGVSSQTIRAEWALPPIAPTSGTGSLGVTEGGSSGSGIFITSGGSQLLIGTLSCGPSACGVTAANRHDSYGEFADTYNTNAAVSTALATGTDDSPGNNFTCATARVLTPTTSTQTISNLILRKSPDFDDWYKITIPGGARLNVSTTFTAGNGNIDMQVFTACGGSAAASTSGSTSPKSLTTVTNPSTAPLDCYVRVYLSSSVRNTYSFAYSYTAAAVTTNNTCAGATTIALGTTAGTNVGATNDTNSTCGTTGSPDVWFQHLAGFTGILQVDTCGSALDTVVSVHSACPAGAVTNQIACNDNTTGCAQAGRSLVQVNVTSGVNYRIRVAGASGATGAFQLTLSQVANPPPANDSCAAATALPAQGSVAYDTSFATTDGPSETLCNAFSSAQVEKDVWFSYTAPYSGTVTFSNCANAAFDSRIAIYSGGCPAAADTAIACDDDGCSTPGSGTPSSVTVPTSYNQTFTVRLGGYLGATGAGLLVVTPTNTCRADIAGLGGTGGAGNGVTVDDLVYYLNAFFANNTSVADLTGPGGSGGPDGSVTVDDLVLYLSLFFAGCP